MVAFFPEQQEGPQVRFSTAKVFLSAGTSFRPNVPVHYLLVVTSGYFLKMSNRWRRGGAA